MRTTNKIRKTKIQQNKPILKLLESTHLLSQIAIKSTNGSPQPLFLFGPGLTINTLPASTCPGTISILWITVDSAFFYLVSANWLILLQGFPHYLMFSVKEIVLYTERKLEPWWHWLWSPPPTNFPCRQFFLQVSGQSLHQDPQKYTFC